MLVKEGLSLKIQIQVEVPVQEPGRIQENAPRRKLASTAREGVSDKHDNLLLLTGRTVS